MKPVSYLQTDPRWKSHDYSAKGEKKTIGSSGCGPTAAAMVIATLKDKHVTPVTTSDWSVAHGYKALNQGTFYSYFIPQFSAYGISCKRLNMSNLYGKKTSSAHTEALNALKDGNWVIACMGKGNWTKSGHFILLYAWENGSVWINDPASTAAARTKNTWELFSGQVKYLWTVTVPEQFKTGNTTASSSVIGRVSNCYQLNMRKTPKVENGNIISVLNINDELTLLDTVNGWYKAETKQHIIGYVSGKYITVQ